LAIFTITLDAFAALAATLPFGSVAVEPERAPDGGVGIWLDHATVAKLPLRPPYVLPSSITRM
jgi:hypothetical protein